MLPPGCARLVASPAWIGSPPIQTIGIESVAARTARAIASVLAMIRSGVAVDNLASEIRVALGPPPAGIRLDREVLSLDTAQPAQLLEKRVKRATARIVSTS